MKKLILTFSLFTFWFSVFAESEGVRFFKQNKPESAIPLLEEEIQNGQATPDSFNYLGLAYYQIGEYEKSISVFEQGLSESLTDKKVLLYNAGNTSFAMKDFSGAIEYYTLSLAASPNFSKALLNRANAYLNASEYSKALDDYVGYLSKVRNDKQEPEIKRMIALLQGEVENQKAEEQALAEAEAERKAEEERLAQARAKMLAEEEERKRVALEEARLADERAKAAEAAKIAAEKAAEDAKRRALLESLANSLQKADAENMTSGAEDSLDYDTEGELD